MQAKPSAPVIYATLTTLLICLATAEPALSDSDPLKAVSGRWYTEGHEGGVEIYPCDNQVCGRFSWMKDDMENARDTHNPDPTQRERRLCHLQFMGGFTPDGKNHYTGGWIYNPRDGGTYSAQMTLVDQDTLDLHGYLFIPLLGQSQTWKRAATMPSCLSD